MIGKAHAGLDKSDAHLDLSPTQMPKEEIQPGTMVSQLYADPKDFGQQVALLVHAKFHEHRTQLDSVRSQEKAQFHMELERLKAELDAMRAQLPAQQEFHRLMRKADAKLDDQDARFESPVSNARRSP